MSKKYQEQQAQNELPEGGDQATQSDTGADTSVEQSTESEVQSSEAPDEVPSTETKAIGIGQFVRHLLMHSTKSNSEILELVLKTFEGSKTTPACIAWYKTDLRKKGLLDGLNQRGKNKTVAFSAEELEALCK
jgi:hypothetical protein